MFIKKSAIIGLFILCIAGQIPAGQTIEPQLRGKQALPDSLSGPGPEILDTFGDQPAKEKFKNAEELRGRLLQAIGMDDIQEARYLISAGAKVNQAFSNTGDTPLMLAQSPAMASMLVESGADVTARDTQNGTVLHYAVTRPAAVELVPFLVKSGAPINARGWKDNNTPFNLAVVYLIESRSADMSIIKILVRLGADINVRDGNGYTGLMQAASMGNGPLADLLLSLGADKTMKNPDGKTAKEIAYESGARYIYQRLE